ncbi:uncharacterized protein LOC113433922 [Pseudonaja textilis]|uniref:uncharacterized protein LOC113433922 n=1 Tax=Pseudonaja textilis TaxID=8673 RepID=UPI000EAA94AF|nr:uncharacterized protein LOC113433922 [Pseudonaja textilis]
MPATLYLLSVNQNHLKSTASRGRRLSEDTEVFPLINSGGSKEQDEITKKHRKQVPEFCKLPQIAESSPSIQREKIKPGELAKELVILPLLVQLESPAKAKSSRGTCFKEVKFETDVYNKQSALLPNDLVLDTNHRNKQKQTINDSLLRASQDTFYLPLINPGKFALNDGKKRKRKVSIGIDNMEQIESHKSTSLNILLTGSNGEIICPSLLRSVQTTDNPREFVSATDEEVLGEDELSIEVRRPACRSPPEIYSEGQASNEKELPLTQQTQHLPRNGVGFENREVITGNEGFSAEFGERHQPSQTGLCRKNYPQQSEEEKGYSSLSQTHNMKQRNTNDIVQDEGKQLDFSDQSTNLFHYEPRLTHLKVYTSEIRQAPNPEYDPIKPFDYREEVMENPRNDLYASEIFGMEEDMTALSESTSQPAGVARLKQAEDVLKSKRTERPKKQPIQKAGDGLKKQKKSLKKKKYQSQKEFVVVTYFEAETET